MDNTFNTRETLIQRAKNPDDHEAWEEFVHYYRRFIYYILNRMNISLDQFDDLVQEILLSLWQKLPEYERQNAKFRSWLSRVTRNAALNYLRTISRENRRKDAALSMIEALNSVSESDLEKRIEQEWKVYLSNIAIEQIEKLIPGKALDAFTLSLQGVSTEEIAERLEITRDSVYTLKNRVKTRLANEISLLMNKLEF